MAKFTFGKTVDIHWNGYEIVGPALTEFTIPDQLYEEFEGDFRDVEPSLTWTDTNEFATLSNSVSVTTLTGTIPISVTSTTSGKIVSISSSTNPAGYYLRADGTGATTWAALPSDATGITNIIGTSPISAAVSGTTATISLNANYQTAGTYVTGVVGTSPISATGTTAITVSLDANYQTAGTYVNAVIGTSPASVSTASGTSTVSIISSSINSTHIADNAIVAAKINAAAVGTAKIDSGLATFGQLLRANGIGGAAFDTVASGATVNISTFTATGTWTKPAGVNVVYVMLLGAGGSGASGPRAISTATATTAESGGGGAKVEAIFDASMLGSTVAVTVGAGGVGISGSTSTTTAVSVEGNYGGDTCFGTSSEYYLFAGGGTKGFATGSNHFKNAKNAVLRWNSTDANTTFSGGEVEVSRPGNDCTSMGAAGGISFAVSSAAISANEYTVSGVSGARGFGITIGISRLTTASTAGANGVSATSGWGTAGSTGHSNNTASGVNSGNGGNGGNGYLGGGGGAGGSVWAASGTSRVTGASGSGGDGYAVVISW